MERHSQSDDLLYAPPVFSIIRARRSVLINVNNQRDRTDINITVSCVATAKSHAKPNRSQNSVHSSTEANAHVALFFQQSQLRFGFEGQSFIVKLFEVSVSQAAFR